MHSFFEFIRRERVYFLGLILCLAISALSQNQQPQDTKQVSLAFSSLQQQADDWNNQVTDSTVWAKVLVEHPLPVVTWSITLLIFGFCLVGGCILLFLRLFIPGIREYFHSVLPENDEMTLLPAHFFRVSVLIYLSIILTSVLMGFAYEAKIIGEQGLGVAQTLLLDSLVCFSIYFVLKESNIKWKSFMGVRSPSVLKEMLRGLTEYVAVFPLFVGSLFILLGVSSLFNYEPPPHPLIEVFLSEEAGSRYILFGAIALVSIIGPIFEEIFFRGFCFRFFKQFCGIKPAIIFSAALFSALHASWLAFIPIFILGVALARLFEKRRNFIACWTFHVVHNILLTVYFFTSKALLEAFHG